MSDRRTAIRVETRIKATLAAGDVRELCSITDLSDNGAKVFVRPDLLIPEIVCLHVPELGLMKSGRIIWRRDAEAGLRFVS